jgi:hypothetical protein
MASLPQFFDIQFFTNAGAIAASHLLYTYANGTSTPKPTYTDATGSVANANPITLNSAGRCPLFLGTGGYSLELKTPAGVLVKRYDNVDFTTSDNVYGDWSTKTFDGDGTEDTFDLEVSPGVSSNMAVYVDGIHQTPGLDYNLSVTNVVFTVPPSSDAHIVVRYGQSVPAGSTVFQATGSTITRTAADKLARDLRTPQDYILTAGTAGVDSTTAVRLWLANGGGYCPAGTYDIDDIDISVPVYVTCHSQAIFRKRTAALEEGRLIEFKAGAEGSVWLGGRIDGKQQTHAAGWSWQGIWDDWKGMYVGCERVTIGFLTFLNWLNHPLVAPGDYLIANSLRFEDCATGPIFGYEFNRDEVFIDRPAGAGGVGQIVRGVICQDVGDVGVADTLQHAFDVYRPKGGVYADVTIIGMGGRADGRSNTASGVTVFLAENCTFENLTYDSPTTDAVRHLAFSFLGITDCTLSNLRAYDFAGLGLEMLTCYGCTVNGGVIDGNYRSGIASATSSIGMIHSAGRYDKDSVSRSQSGSRHNTFNGTVLRRNGLGASFRSGRATANGIHVTGALGTGILVQNTTVTATFPGSAAEAAASVTLNNCVVEFCGAQGVNATTADSCVINGGRIENNGQDSTLAATTRSGFAASTMSRVSAVGTQFNDTQSFTVTDGASFAPGTTADEYQIAIHSPRQYSTGQMITLVDGGGAAVDITGRVIDVDGDLVTLSIDGGATFSSTGNTTALTGTWAGSGRTLTGTGGAALTEITGPVWVVTGGVYRLVEKVTSDNSIQVTEAFPAALSGATLSKVTVDVDGIPSQQYGIRLFGTVTSWHLKSNSYQGNVIERTEISASGGAEVGTEYFRKEIVTTNATPLGLITGFPQGHRHLGFAAKVTTAISGGGATSWTLLHTDGVPTVGSPRETLGSTVALTLNTAIGGGAMGYSSLAGGDQLTVTFAGGTPTAGQITIESLFRVDGVPAL